MKHTFNKETRADFTTVVFRFPTAFGVSPRMRFDLTINEFVRDVLLGKELEIFGEEFWSAFTVMSLIFLKAVRWL